MRAWLTRSVAKPNPRPIQDSKKPRRVRQRGFCSSVAVGGESVYGLGRFPVTLYKEQWAKLLDMADEIRTFIKENESKLKTKGE